MTKGPRPLENLTAAAEKTAEQTMEQARGAMDHYFDWVQKSMSASPLADTELGKKVMSCAERNFAAANEYVQNLSRARDFQDIIRIQTEFMQTQLQTFADQSRSFYESYTKVVGDAMKTSPFKLPS
jgi:hypothetical protein